MSETHFPRITFFRLERSRGPVPSRALYPGFTVHVLGVKLKPGRNIYFGYFST